MTACRIGEVTRRFGVSADTLRYYEKIGLLPQVARYRVRRDWWRLVVGLARFGRSGGRTTVAQCVAMHGNVRARALHDGRWPVVRIQTGQRCAQRC